MLAPITMLLGGRAAEIVSFGVVTTGAASDIERATELAWKMVAQYGMSERFGSMGLQNAENQYLGGRNVLTCSEQTNLTRRFISFYTNVKTQLFHCERKTLKP